MTEQVTKKRRQHYVPKLLLRKFSLNEAQVAVYLIDKKQLIEPVGLKEQCYEFFYYGRDGKLEDAFSLLEGSIDNVLKKLIELKINDISEKEILELRMFLIYQLNRTVGAAQRQNEMTSTILKKIFSEHLRGKGYDDFDAESVEINLNKPQLWALYGASMAIPIILDLHFKILISDPGNNFIISDNPVALYNQYAEHTPSFAHCKGTRGLALKGLQMFMPISPNMCLAMFDPHTYQYGSPKSLTGRIGKKDVQMLNQLQMINAVKCVYSQCKAIDLEVFNELEQYRQQILPTMKTTIEESEVKTNFDGTKSKIIHTITPDIKIGRQFSFSKIIDNNKYTHPHSRMPVRSPELIKIAKEYEADIKARKFPAPKS